MTNEASTDQLVEGIRAEALAHISDVVNLTRSLTGDQYGRLVQLAKEHVETSDTVEQFMLLSWLRCELSIPSRRSA